MVESFIHKNLADKRKQIMAHIGSLEQDLEQARRDLSAIIATERVFQARGPDVTAYMNLSYLFPRHELPKLAKAALEANNTPMSTVEIAAHVIAAKELDTTDRHLRKAVTYKLVQLLRQWEKKRKVKRVGKTGTTIVWRL